MKKYTTKPIDFTGCHPVIAEALKRGEAIECLVWDREEGLTIKAWVYGYAADSDTTYKYKTIKEAFRYAGPIPIRVKRIMPPERAIPTLIAEGWRFDHRGALSGEMYCIVPKMFEKMGSRFDDPNTISWSWPPCIIEEVEDDE